MANVTAKLNEEIRIRLRGESELTGVDSVGIIYIKPSGKSGEWTAAVDGDDNQRIYYDTSATDLDETGDWRLVMTVTKSGKKTQADDPSWLTVEYQGI